NITAAGVLTKIGATVGTSIATYAGRVWIGNNNTLSFTDINSYNSFGGAGGSATLSDQYLGQGITVLYAANNYLYIFGSTSVDVLSNVTVNAGVTSFSRVNVLQGIGCLNSNNMTVIGLGRGIVFLDVTGLYMLAGATPERISERIQGCVRAGVINSPGPIVRPSCGLVNLNDELCLAFQVNIGDTFSHPTTQAQRILVFIYQRHRWWVTSDQFGDAPGVTAVGPLAGTPPLGTIFGAFRLQANTLPTWHQTQLFSGNKHWQLRTKLWDGGKNFSEKQGLNVAISCQWVLGLVGPARATGITFTVDSELQNTNAPVAIPNVPTLFIGQFPQQFATQIVSDLMATNQAYGSQYIGLTFFGALVSGSMPMAVLECVAMRGKQERNMLE
ncbi:MAG: hypothetical protein HRJ53_03455, partial [Acidobacteria bacterium Pan2503]|nr:hypothetical protein [Candidatus Acidoferrum panamensis]